MTLVAAPANDKVSPVCGSCSAEGSPWPDRTSSARPGLWGHAQNCPPAQNTGWQPATSVLAGTVDRPLHAVGDDHGMVSMLRFKLQDYFIISLEKLECGWTLTTPQYTISHIVYFKTQRILKIQNLHNKRILKIQNLHNKQTSNLHTHTLLWCLDRFICSEMLLTAEQNFVFDLDTRNLLPDGRSS